MQDATFRGWPQAVLFDLDGTLIDSAGDIAAAINEVLSGDRLGPLPVTQVRSMVGNGVRRLVERAYEASGEPLDDITLDERYARMMKVYGNHLTRLTTLLPGAASALRTSRELGAKVAVVTNKPEGFSRQILAHFGLLPDVDLIVGGDSGPARKPAPDMLLHALKAFAVAPSAAIMVGDGPADIDAAWAAGVPVVAVDGGYAAVPAAELGADTVIASLADLPDAVVHLAARA
jgi:phosphoglycolate phosphatase